jgi:hypothetical protein
MTHRLSALGQPANLQKLLSALVIAFVLVAPAFALA